MAHWEKTGNERGSSDEPAFFPFHHIYQFSFVFFLFFLIVSFLFWLCSLPSRLYHTRKPSWIPSSIPFSKSEKIPICFYSHRHNQLTVIVFFLYISDFFPFSICHASMTDGVLSLLIYHQLPVSVNQAVSFRRTRYIHISISFTLFSQFTTLYFVFLFLFQPTLLHSFKSPSACLSHLPQALHGYRVLGRTVPFLFAVQ